MGSLALSNGKLGPMSAEESWRKCKPSPFYAACPHVLCQLSELGTFSHSPLPTPKVTTTDCELGRIFQAVPAHAVNKLGAQKCDGKAFPPGVHRPSRTFMSHYSPYSSLCPNKSETLCRDGLDHNESFCWHFPFTGANNGAKLPHLAAL